MSIACTHFAVSSVVAWLITFVMLMDGIKGERMAFGHFGPITQNPDNCMFCSSL